MARASKQNPDLVELALERGFKVHAGMSNRDLGDLLGPTPPSAEQIRYAEFLAGQPVPLKTFAHARRAICDLELLRNAQALELFDWKEGDVLLWEDEYYLILRIYGSKAYYRFYLQVVDLEPAEEGGGTRAVKRTVTPRYHNPHTLRHAKASRADLSTWPVTLENPPSSH